MGQVEETWTRTLFIHKSSEKSKGRPRERRKIARELEQGKKMVLNAGDRGIEDEDSDDIYPTELGEGQEIPISNVVAE